MSVAVMVDIKLAQLWKKVVGKVNSKLYSLAIIMQIILKCSNWPIRMKYFMLLYDTKNWCL